MLEKLVMKGAIIAGLSAGLYCSIDYIPKEINKYDLLIPATLLGVTAWYLSNNYKIRKKK